MSSSKRRRSLALLALGVAATSLLAACAGPGDESADAVTGDTRTITDVSGEVTIPVNPERIVALDEASALTLLSIGITPTVVFDSWQTTVPLAVLEEAGIEIAQTDAFFPELEEVAAQNPDLIIGSVNEAYLTRYPDYASIAPSIAAQMQPGPGGESIVEAYGHYFDRAEEAAAVTAALESTAAEVAALQADAPLVLTALMAYAPETMVMYMDGDNSLAGLIADAGFVRPALQDVKPEGGSMYGGWTPFSPETLLDHDGDVAVVAVAAQYPLAGIVDLPLYDSLAAVQSGRSVVVDGDMWAGGSSFYQYWVLEDLRGIAEGSNQAGDIDAAAARWSDFLALIGH